MIPGTYVLRANYVGSYGSWLSFDGTDDYVEVSYSASLNPANISIELWIKWFATPPAGMEAIGRGICPNIDASYPYSVGQWGGTLYGRFANGTGTVSVDISGIALDTWEHYVFTYDGSHVLGYKNSVYRATRDLEGELPDKSTSLFLGALSSSQRFLNGSIDGVRIYNRTLTQTEITYNFQHRYGDPYSAEGLVGFWKMNEGSGDAVSDSSGEDNHGSRVGATWISDYNDKYSHVFGLAFEDGDNTWVNATYNYQTQSWLLLQGSSIVGLPAVYVTESAPYIAVRYQINFKASCTPSPSVDVWLRSNNTEGNTAEWEKVETGLFSIGKITIDVFLPDLSLLKQYWLTGDLVGLVFAILGLHFGQQLVGGILVFAFTYILYDRTESLPYCCILWIITGVFFEALIPMSFFNIGHLLLALGFGLLFLRLLRGS